MTVHSCYIHQNTLVLEPHIPDLTTPSGLCDFMALGNLCVLGTILERQSYVGDMDPNVVKECLVARWHYEQIRLWFHRQYTITVGGTMVMPSSVFGWSLVKFMAGLVNQKYLYVEDVPEVPGCSAKELNRRVVALLRSEFPELELAFTNLLDGDHEKLSWDGPEMEIKVREADDDLAEAMDFDDFVLFPEEDELNSGDNMPTSSLRENKCKRADMEGEKSQLLT